MTRTSRAALAALALAFAVAPVAAAADVAESFSVNSTITVTGIPATLDYGAIDAGATSAVQAFSAKVTTNSTWSMLISATAFDRTGGGDPIPASARDIQLSSAGNTAQIQKNPYGWVAYGSAEYGDATADASGNAGTNMDVTTELRLNVPGAAAPGDYSGVLTLTFTAS